MYNMQTPSHPPDTNPRSPKLAKQNVKRLALEIIKKTIGISLALQNPPLSIKVSCHTVDGVSSFSVRCGVDGSLCIRIDALRGWWRWFPVT